MLALKKLPLVVVLLTHSDAHLVLHVRELKYLLFQLLPNDDQLFGLLVQFSLHLVEVAIEHGYALLQVTDLLVFSQELALVRLDVIE